MASLQIIYRFLLLALLPAIAITIYLNGQRYDPALIDFKTFQTSIDNDELFFPREIDGFSRPGQVRIYTKVNLYEQINGHAEYFIGAGFVSLSVGEYIKTGSDPAQPDAVVEIYDMGKNIQAFGVLSDEAGDKASAVKIGMMGFKTGQGINFIAGKYYVKVITFNNAVPAINFAKNIEEKIGAKTESFEAFLKFPDIGDVVKTRYIKEAYRGLGFLNNVLEREYKINGSSVQVFLFAGEEYEIKTLRASFFDFFRKSEVKYIAVEKYGKTFYKIMDPYEGDWYLLSFRKAMFGIYGSDNDAIVKEFSIAEKESRNDSSLK